MESKEEKKISKPSRKRKPEQEKKEKKEKKAKKKKEVKKCSFTSSSIEYINDLNFACFLWSEVNDFASMAKAFVDDTTSYNYEAYPDRAPEFEARFKLIFGKTVPTSKTTTDALCDVLRAVYTSAGKNVTFREPFYDFACSWIGLETQAWRDNPKDWRRDCCRRNPEIGEFFYAYRIRKACVRHKGDQYATYRRMVGYVTVKDRAPRLDLTRRDERLLRGDITTMKQRWMGRAEDDERADLIVRYTDSLLGLDYSSECEKVNWPVVLKQKFEHDVKFNQKGIVYNSDWRKESQQKEAEREEKRKTMISERKTREAKLQTNRVYTELLISTMEFSYFMRHTLGEKVDRNTFRNIEIELLTETLLRVDLFLPSYFSCGFFERVKPMLAARAGLTLKRLVEEFYLHSSRDDTKTVDSSFLSRPTGDYEFVSHKNFFRLAGAIRQYRYIVSSCLISISRQTTLMNERGVMSNICDFVVGTDITLT